MEFWKCLIVLAVLNTSSCRGDVSCFKKFRPTSDTCGGLYKRKKIVSTDHCCGGLGMGFTTQEPEMLSRNKYKCVSCKAWERQKNLPDPSSVTVTMDSETSCTKTHYYEAGDVYKVLVKGKVHDGHCPLTFIQSGSYRSESLDDPCFSVCVKIISYSMESCEVKMSYHDGLNDFTPVKFDCHTFPPVMWCSSKNDLKVSVSEQKNYHGKDYYVHLEVTPYCGTYQPTTEDFRCFRKYRDRQQTCGGPLRRNAPTTPVECCSGNGSGFSRSGLVKLRKNQYTCMSCEEWRRENETRTDPVTTTEPPMPAEWGAWGHCSTSCFHGVQTRHRLCTNCDRNHYSNMEVRDCVINFYCPIDGQWGEWTSWEHCSVSCNGGIRRRYRKCDSPKPKYGGRICAGLDTEQESCNDQPCPVDGHWGQWSRFGRCSATCGLGTMVRRRMCTSPSPKHGGKPCQGPSENSRRCEHRKCPVHGGWSSWNAWSACPVTCGSGTRTRTRQCDTPSPWFGGRPCDGSPVEEETCDVGYPCPVDGGWSSWNNYGRCRAEPCKEGHKLRSRVCNNPRPQHGGLLCRGRSVERTNCVNTEDCVVDGGWCEFSDWSSCSATCQTFSAVQTRSRTCQCPEPQNGGRTCTGETTEWRVCQGIQPCNQPVVNVDEG